MKKTELVFIPSPGYAHLSSTVEIAKLLAERDANLFISVIIMIFPNDTKVSSFVKSLSTNSSSSSSLSRIKFIELIPETIDQTGLLSLYKFIDSHKSQVRDFLAGLISDSESVKLCGVVVDMFCTSMIDVTNELDIPSYGFFTCSAAMLGLLFYFQGLRDDSGKYVKDSETGFSIPSYRNPVPYGVLPPMVFKNQDGCDEFMDIGKRFRETKGILVNTFLELESYAIEALSRDETIPKVYTLGPILGLKSSDTENPETVKIMKWLDLQPEKSVVYLCFGSYGHFGDAQVKEIANALEGSGHRFLWSLRKPPAEGKFEFPGEYKDLEEVLPEGFLRRTDGVGMVIGWAPQTAVLSHSAVGGFVSHCGWSSVLESIWFGVPLATWPLYAEQQVNAFELVTDLGLAVEVKMDYKTNLMKHDADEIIKSDAIEEKIKVLMDPGNGIRKKVKEMKEMSRLVLEEGGSSYASLKCFINSII